MINVTEQEFLDKVTASGYGGEDFRILKSDCSAMVRRGEKSFYIIDIKVYSSKKEMEAYLNPILAWRDGVVTKDTIGIF